MFMSYYILSSDNKSPSEKCLTNERVYLLWVLE